MTRSRRRRLGQSFLIDQRVSAAIGALLASSPARVFEIGPGRGALTEVLLDRFERVLAIEIDEQLIPALRARFAPRLELRHGDALGEPLAPLLAAEAPWQVAANLPYSVATAILRRLLPRHDLISRLVLMLQREVAERLLASPGERGHGLMALERAAYGEARLAFQVPPSAFRPRPKVMSTVVSVDLAPPTYEPAQLAGAFAVAAQALTRPRKVLANAVGQQISSQEIVDAELDPRARPGTVSLAGWVRLAALTSADLR